MQSLQGSKYPFIITKVKQWRLKKFIDEAKKEENLLLADYPKEMLTTSHDDELAQEISNKNNSDFEYLGAIIYGDSEKVSSLSGKFTLWK